MYSRPNWKRSACVLLLTLAPLAGCSLFSKPSAVAVQCPAPPPLPHQARQSSELRMLLENVSTDIERWLQLLEKGSPGPAPASGTPTR